jgi:hypothetical protein
MIITNLGNYDKSEDINETEYDKITSLNITNKNDIDEALSNIIVKFINLKKVDLSGLKMYEYMAQFLLFDIVYCTALYQYITDTKNLIKNDFDVKKAEFLFKTRNIELDYKNDIIEQMQNKRQELDIINVFYRKLSKLNIEYLKCDYFVDDFFDFTSLIEFDLSNTNYFMNFTSENNINIFLKNNSNLKKFKLHKYNFSITEEYVFYLKGDFLDHYADDYKEHNSYDIICDQYIDFIDCNYTEFYNHPDKYFGDEYFNKILCFKKKKINFDKLKITPKLKMLSL